MTITFYGAAQGVTGSRHLLEFNNYKILLDCGFFQGHRKESRESNSGFAFDPKSIDNVILSHAHLDHCGMLPLLIKQGFKGKIYSTPATKDVARQMLLDSAGIQESDYYYMRKNKIGGRKLAEPLYTRQDIPQVMKRFKILDYARNRGSWAEILPEVKLKFYDAGHILGSAVSVLEIILRCHPGAQRAIGSHGKIKDSIALLQNDNKKTFRLAYTGDLGKKHTPLLHNPKYIKESINVLISESTYGAHQHKSNQEAHEQLIRIIKRICQTQGKLIVPAFSLGRTQEFVYILHHLTDTGRIPRVPIFVDSPLAGRITQVFRKYRDDYDIESRLDFPRKGDVPLAFRNLKYTESRNESIQLNYAKGPLVIISASGMAEGGRILHHLKHNLRSNRNTILFTGYQAEHTLGRKILEHKSPVKVFNRWYKVRAQVEVLNELSAHADGPQLAEYITHCKGLKKVFLVHGELDRAKQLKQLLNKANSNLGVKIPKLGQTFNIYDKTRS